MKTKRFIFSVMALCCTMVAWAQNEVPIAILQNGDNVHIYKGAQAFVNAVEAADHGDVITLSQGVFDSNINVTKSIKIYGAGFEDDATAGTEITLINGPLYFVSLEDNTPLASVYLEGLCFSNCNVVLGQSKGNPSSTINDVTITKCKNISTVAISQNVLGSMVVSNCVLGKIEGSKTVVKNMWVKNCYLSGTVKELDPQSDVLVDHCIIGGCYDKNYTYAQVRFTNDIFASTASYSNDQAWLTFNGVGSYVDHCLYNTKRIGGSYGVQMRTSYGSVTNCTPVPYDQMFSDATDAAYTPERTFILSNDEWIGTDGKPIGIIGGDGFNKVPTTPTVKSLQLGVSGTTLSVTYDAGVR